MDRIIIALMAFFLVLGALDKALFDNRFGFGNAFEEGLNTMGPLVLVMVGIMCAAPALGNALTPILTPFFLSLGSDPALIAGIFFGPDAGGLVLAQAIAKHPEAIDLFGVCLASTLASILLMPLPLSLSIVPPSSRPFVAKGIAIGLIASPLSMLGAVATGHCSLSVAVHLGFPAIVVALVLALCLIVWQTTTIKVFLFLGRVIIGIFALLLAVAALENFFSVHLIPGMAPIEPQLGIVGEIGIMLAGAYPMVYFVKTFLSRALQALAHVLTVDANAALGMIVSSANPIPMYAMLESMSNRGKVICSAFSGPILCTLGDHLGFMAAYYPQGINMLITGKFIAAAAALALALLFERNRS